MLGVNLLRGITLLNPRRGAGRAPTRGARGIPQLSPPVRGAKHQPDVDVMRAGGRRDLATMKRSYEQADGATTLR